MCLNKPNLNGKYIYFICYLEVLADPAIANKLADTKAATEIKCIDQFYTMLMTDPNKAYYGLKHVQKANEAQAIDTLLISDKLFR